MNCEDSHCPPNAVSLSLLGKCGSYPVAQDASAALWFLTEWSFNFPWASSIVQKYVYLYV